MRFDCGRDRANDRSLVAVAVVVVVVVDDVVAAEQSADFVVEDVDFGGERLECERTVRRDDERGRQMAKCSNRGDIDKCPICAIDEPSK